MVPEARQVPEAQQARQVPEAQQVPDPQQARQVPVVQEVLVVPEARQVPEGPAVQSPGSCAGSARKDQIVVARRCPKS